MNALSNHPKNEEKKEQSQNYVLEYEQDKNFKIEIP